MRSTVIVGIDPSLTGTAICVLDREEGKLLHNETFKTKLRGIERLIYIRDSLKTILISYINSISGVFIEGYGFGCRGAAIFDLGELGGVLRTMLYEGGFLYYNVPPTVLKMFVTGKGNSHKNVMLEQTFRRWNLGSEILTDDDQVDAYGLCQYGDSYLRWRAGETKFTRKENGFFFEIKWAYCKMQVVETEIIVLGYGLPDVERECFYSVCTNTTPGTYIFTYMDNVCDVLSLTEAWNKLIGKSQCAFICLLNSDTWVCPGWLSLLLEPLRRSKQLGFTGPSTNNCHSPQKQIATYEEACKHKGEIAIMKDPISGFCLVFNRDIWVKTWWI